MIHDKKQISKQFRSIIFIIILWCFVGCGAQNKNLSQIEKDAGIIVGFSQIGAESAWRTCNTRSVQDAAAERGVQLVYDNAEQKQENQRERGTGKNFHIFHKNSKSKVFRA